MSKQFADELPARLTAKQIVQLLEEQLHNKDWLFFSELRVGTGYASDAEQRIDAYAIHPFPSRGLSRIAYEIKVSRSDFLLEVKNPQKRRRAMLLSNMFYFVAPKGLISIQELPLDCGLIEAITSEHWPNGYLNTRVKAPCRDIASPPWLFVAALVRRAFRDGEAKAQAQAREALRQREAILREQL